MNEIHLKFEAEVRLLNDFNESLRHFTSAEKAFEHLKSRNESNITVTKVLQNADTQTSLMTKTSTNITTTRTIEDTSRQQTAINYSRGSDINEEIDDFMPDNNSHFRSVQNNSTISTGWDLSNINSSVESVGLLSVHEETALAGLGAGENIDVGNCAAGLSLNMVSNCLNCYRSFVVFIVRNSVQKQKNIT